MVFTLVIPNLNAVTLTEIMDPVVILIMSAATLTDVMNLVILFMSAAILTDVMTIVYQEVPQILVMTMILLCLLTGGKWYSVLGVGVSTVT